MDIFHVIDFIKTAECGNYSEAADELYISQSSLSKHIQALERVLGVELFNRTTRKISLSKGGELFLPYAKELERIFLTANNELRYLIAENYQKLSLGCIPVMASYGIMDVITGFKTKNPDININLIEWNFNSGKIITEALMDFEFEMAFCDSVDIKSDKFETIIYCEDQLIAVLYHNHPLASLKTIDLKLLVNEKLLFLDKTSPVHHMCYSICKEAGFTPNVCFLGSRTENLLELVASDMGVALLMKKCTNILHKKNIVIRKIRPSVKRVIYLARVAKRNHSEVANCFWDFISDLS